MLDVSELLHRNRTVSLLLPGVATLLAVILTFHSLFLLEYFVVVSRKLTVVLQPKLEYLALRWFVVVRLVF